MAEQPTGTPAMTLTEATKAGLVIPPKGKFQPQGATHMGQGRDPAQMDFEVVDGDQDEAVDGDLAEAVEVAGTAAEIEGQDDPDGLAELIELSESGDGKWLLLPICDGHEYRVAKRLPHRRLQKLIKQVRGQRDLQNRAGGDMLSLSDEELEMLIDSTVGILKLVMCPADLEALDAGLDDLESPIDTPSLAAALGAVLPRYMRGIGGAKGKQQGS